MFRNTRHDNAKKGSKMNLYIFEPYKWYCCGRAVGIIAETFDEAIKVIVETDKIRAARKAKKFGLSVDTHRQYRPEYFHIDTKVFVEDSSDQWLLTHTVPLSKILGNRFKPGILFDNWNYS